MCCWSEPLGEAIWLLLETEFAPLGIRGVGMITNDYIGMYHIQRGTILAYVGTPYESPILLKKRRYVESGLEELLRLGRTET